MVYSNANMYHGHFEKAFAEYIDVKYAMAFPTCTSALHLSLLALGIGPGDCFYPHIQQKNLGWFCLGVQPYPGQVIRHGFTAF